MSPRAAEQAETGPYAGPEERAQAQRLGMFVFLASESLLFAGLFALYAGYRATYPEVFAAGVRQNEEWIGSVNTMLLLLSSALVAFADHGMRSQRMRAAPWCLGGAWLLGLGFISLKALEYTEHFHKGIIPGPAYSFAGLRGPGASLFFTLYYLMTGLHALHVLAGLAVIGWLAVAVWRRPHTPSHVIRIELAGLYWHVVDIVWIFLWPVLYLMH